ncbi:uncharacterized protein RJT20DRAFT_37097 [Scheffersomyces xylosifermentans]|uniref:uncharacterized protein n=1 Tax=Scheffersomyces xylosifermentans TaxID=1304137 RepID=UPI00315D7F86
MAGDLNLKKSWNPALVKNQKKVWEEEQNKLKELKRIKERNAEYEKEQEYRNLLKLQYGEDFKQEDLKKGEKLKLSKLNWMYDDMPKVDDPKENSSGFIESNEEFTEGKSKVENLLNGHKSFSYNKTNDNINRIINLGKTPAPRDEKRIAMDDPLLSIKNEQLKHRSAPVHSQRSRESSIKTSNSSSRQSDRDRDRERNRDRDRDRDRERSPSSKRHHRSNSHRSDSHRHRHRHHHHSSSQSHNSSDLKESDQNRGPRTESSKIDIKSNNQGQ